MLLRTLVALSFVPGLAFVSAPAIFWAVFADATVTGLRVAGDRLESAEPRAELEARADRFLARPFVVEVDGRRFETDRRELGVGVDVTAMQDAVLAVGHSGNPYIDLRDRYRASRGEVDLAWRVTRDDEVLRAFVEELRAEVRREPVPAVLELEARVAQPAVAGHDLDLDAAVAALSDALADGDDAVALDLVPIDVPARDRLPAGLRLDATLATYSTEYVQGGRYRGRAHNVELATTRLHAAVIEPGAVLSFNERVGARSRAAGFQKAPVISGGELVDGLGGGVCQVASTLYAAAMYAGFEVVEHRPHSRPSSYVPMGMDATVVWPEVDLKVRNPFDFPVVVFARAVDGHLVVDLVGAEAPREVEIERTIVSRFRFGERVIHDPSLPPGAREVTQRGIRGARIERVRLVRQGDVVVAERDEVRYPPTDRIVRVGGGALPASAAPVGTWPSTDPGPIAQGPTFGPAVPVPST